VIFAQGEFMNNYGSSAAALFAVHARQARQAESPWQADFEAWLLGTPTRKQKQRSALTIEAYLRDVKLFAEWSQKVNGMAFEPEYLNKTDLTSYFKGLESSPATHNRKLASLRILITWARETGQLDYDPAAWIPAIDATRESPRDVEDADWKKLEAAAQSQAHSLIGLRDLLIFRLLGSAGLRIHEVVGLQLDDLHLADGYIHILGKGQKHRKVRVGGKLVQVILDWQAKMPVSLDGTLVTDLKGNAIDRISAWRRFEMIAAAAGVKTTPHAMRHTYIYRFMDKLMAGDKGKLPAAIDAVCQQTGDRPEVILAYYTRARESEMRAVAEEM
jgi:site-specific recombinase XerD